MMYLSCMTTSTSSSDFPAYNVCCNCGHEHQSVDLDDIVILDAEGYVRQVNDADEIKPGTTVLCADEDACERRMGRMEPLPDYEIDWSDPPEDAAPAHLDGEPDEGQPGDDFYGSDAAFDEYRMDQGWDD